MSPIIKEAVHIARKEYICDDCHKAIKKQSTYNYLFGSAHKYEKPYSIRVCIHCKPIQT